MSIITLKKNMTYETYSEKSFVIRGDTKNNKDLLKSLKGRFNPYLKGGPGWIFSSKNLDTIIDKIGKKEKEKKKKKKKEKEKKKKKYICTHCSKKHRTIKKLDLCCTCKECGVFVEECQCQHDSSDSDDLENFVDCVEY